MSRDRRYDPEDLEKLLSTKSFSELLPEEKAFVLQFIESDLEYDSIRETFSKLGTLPELEPEITPRAKTKEALLAAFNEEDDKIVPVIVPEGDDKKSFWTWFWNPKKSIYAQPALQLASLIVVFSVGFYMLTNQSSAELAQESNNSSAAKTDQKRSYKSQAKNRNKEIGKLEIGEKAISGADTFNIIEPEHAEVKSLKIEDLGPGSADDLKYASDEGKSNDLNEINVTLPVGDHIAETSQIISYFDESNSSISADVTYTNSEGYVFPDAALSELDAKLILDGDGNTDVVEDEDEFSPRESVNDNLANEEFKDSFEKAKKEKELIETKQLDTALIVILDDDAFASDYRITAGNSSTTGVQASTSAGRAIDSPSVLFDLDIESDKAPAAVTANVFSGLLNKLYTSN